MPTRRLVKITAWSYSRYETYTTCPFKAKCSIIDKIREPENDAMRGGSRVHALADVAATGVMPRIDKDNAHLEEELRATLKSKKLPVELETFTEEFKALKKQPTLLTESEWAFDREWVPVDWFSPQAWLRIKVDAHYLTPNKVHIIDHKTGKVYPAHEQQRSLYALGAFLTYPDVTQVRAEHWYVTHGIEEGNTYQVTELPALKKEWLKRTEAMLNDTTFAPRPGAYCSYCYFSRSKHGPCTY